MALSDMVSGLGLWRLWVRLGWNDILQRYRLSPLGPSVRQVISLGILDASEVDTTACRSFALACWCGI